MISLCQCYTLAQAKEALGEVDDAGEIGLLKKADKKLPG